MSMYTKGPWKAIRTHTCSKDIWYVIVDNEGRGPIIEVGGKDKNGQIAEAKYLITDPITIQSNAQLIAMAPDLFKACKEAYTYLNKPYGSEFGNVEIIDKLYKVLSKVEKNT